MAAEKPIQELIEHFNKLPGIGPKTAEKFVYYLLKQNNENLIKFSESLKNLKAAVKVCPVCFDFTSQTPCALCRDPRRDHGIICVVSESADLLALEKSGNFNGVYHVLGGLVNQIEGVEPEQLKIKELVQRIKTQSIKEIILALDATMEGETTVLYLAQALKPLGVKITRLARGLPMGSDLEYADEITLSSALQGRREI